MPGGYTFDRLRDELASRIAAIPEFRAKLADSQLNLDYPVWVDDDAFDLDRHLLRIELPSPGGRRELAEICGHIASAPLDRSKPLWEMWVIEGVADTDPRAGGLLAVMTKVHHAAVDGVSGADLLSQLCSVEPDVPPPEPVEGAGSAGPLQIAAGGLVRFALRPWQLANLMPTTVATIVKTLGRARNGLTMAAPFAAPATRFNTSVTADRNVALAQLDLDDIKKVKDRFKRHGQRRGDGLVRVGAAVVLERLRRAARQVAGGDGAGVGARQVRPSGPQPVVGDVLQPRDEHR